MSSRQYLADVATRHAVFIQRYGGGQSKRAEKLLFNLHTKIAKRLETETSLFAKDRLKKVLLDIDALAMVSFEDISAFIHSSNIDLLRQESLFEVELLDKSTSDNITSFTAPTDQQLEFALKNKTMGLVDGKGMTVQDAVDQFSRSKRKHITQTIRDGILLGDSTDKIVKELSTVIKKLHRRQLESLVRTATNHSATVARLATFEANSDVISGYRWLSTLDSRTTLICAGRDNKFYALDSGIVPPAHWGCRSTIIPEIKPEYDIGSDLTGERFARDADGKRIEVSDKLTYGGWLKQQPKEFQVEVLGKTRAKLFRSGKIKIEQFTGDLGQTLTLKELEATHDITLS